MVVQTVAFWNWTYEEHEPSITVSSPALTDSQAIEEYQKLSPPMRRLIQKSRINIKEGGTAMPYDWLNGNGVLSPTVCMFRDVGPRPTSAHKIARHDSTKPHGPGNSFWTTMGRPPREVIVAGRVLTLRNVARMAGVSEAAVSVRMKSTPIESVVLTSKHNRQTYPYNDAVAFLKSIDLYSENACILVRQERERFDASLKKTEQQSLQKKYSSFCSRPMVQKIFRLLDLEIDECDKIRLLAFYAAPTQTKQSTRGILAKIIDRCTNSDSDGFAGYGERGIKVDSRWIDGDGKLSGLQCFVIDVGIAQPGLELDRIDNDGNYERSNCRWVTRLVNARNCFRAEHIADRLNAMVEAKIGELLRTGL